MIYYLNFTIEVPPYHGASLWRDVAL